MDASLARFAGGGSDSRLLLHHRPCLPCSSSPCSSSGSGSGSGSLSGSGSSSRLHWGVASAGLRLDIAGLCGGSSWAGPGDANWRARCLAQGQGKLKAVSFYKVVELPGYEALRRPLRELCDARDVVGDIVVGADGINGSICGAEEGVEEVLAMLQAYPGLAGIWKREVLLDAGRVQHGRGWWGPAVAAVRSGLGVAREFLGRVRSARHGEDPGGGGRTPILDLHLSLASVSARRRMEAGKRQRPRPRPELAWIRVAAGLLLARVLGSAVLFVISCYRDQLRWMEDSRQRVMQGAGVAGQEELVMQFQGRRYCSVLPSVPWSPVALEFRFKWQRKNGKHMTCLPRVRKGEARTLSCAAAEDYKRAVTLDALGMSSFGMPHWNSDSSQGYVKGNSFLLQARGKSGESAAARKKRKEKTDKRRKNEKPSSVQKVGGFSGSRPESAQPSRPTQRQAPAGRSASVDSQAGRGAPVALETQSSGSRVSEGQEFRENRSWNGGANRSSGFGRSSALPSQVGAIVEEVPSTARIEGAKEDGRAFLSYSNDMGTVLTSASPATATTSTGFAAESVVEAPESTNGTGRGGGKQASQTRLARAMATLNRIRRTLEATPDTISESSTHSSDAMPDWIRNMANERERWIVESQLAAQQAHETVADDAARPIMDSAAGEEALLSVVSRLRTLQSKLVATQSALLSRRPSLPQSEDYLNEIHSKTVDELERASDALEFKEDKLIQSISALRDSQAKARSQALSMEVMNEDHELTKLQEGRETIGTGVPPLKRTAKVVWPNPGREVAIAGSFNGWSSQVKMVKSNAGVFVAKLELYPGRYEIKFVVDGSWRVDPQRPIVYDQGFENNVLIIF